MFVVNRIDMLIRVVGWVNRQPRSFCLIAIIFTCGVINMVVKGTIKSLGFFLQSVTNDVTETTMPSTYIAASFHLCFNLFSPFASWFCTYIGYPSTAALGLLISAIGLGGASISSLLPVQVISIGVVFGIGATLSFTPGIIKINAIFHKTSGLVNGLVLGANVIGGMLIPKIYTMIYANSSHQMAMLVISLLVLFSIPFTLSYLVNDSETSSGIQESSSEPKKESVAKSNLSLRELFKRHSAFTIILITLSQCLNAAGFLNFNNFVTLYLESKNFTLEAITNFVIGQNLADLCGRILGPRVGDKFPGTFILLYTIGTISSGASAALLSFSQEIADDSQIFLAFAICMVGFFSGLFIAGWNSLIKEQFGNEDFMIMYNVSIVFAGLIQFGLTIASGYVYDNHSPNALLMVLCALLVLAGICTMAVIIRNLIKRETPRIQTS